MDPTDDWVAVVTQLERYTGDSEIRDVIIMDETVGIYFRFRAKSCHFLSASTELDPDFRAECSRLSLRELVVCAIMSSLDRNNIELRDYVAENYPITVERITRQCHNIITECEPPRDTENHPGPTEDSRRARKRRRMNRFGFQDAFDMWLLGASIKLEFLPDKAPLRVAHAQSSGSRDATNSGPPDVNPASASTNIATLTVERTFKKNVALLTDGESHFVAKVFTPDSYQDANQSLDSELAVYAECECLQGTYLPYLYGVGRVLNTPARYGSCVVMLSEYIGSRTTVAHIIDDYYEYDDERIKVRLTHLQESVMRALHSLHNLKVVHVDVAGRNMVVDDQDQIVLVDFEHAMVLKENLLRFKSRRDEDLKKLEEVFILEEYQETDSSSQDE